MVIRIDSWLYKLAAMFPASVVKIEHARVGVNCVDYCVVGWAK